MITAKIETQTRIIPVSTPNERNERNEAIKKLQNAVYSLTPQDGKCRFVIVDNENEIYSWKYQPTFREDLTTKESKNAEVKEQESKYEWGFICYVLRNGEEMDYDNFYKGEWNYPESFDEEKDAHAFMKTKGYDRCEYNIVYEYSVWTKNEDWVCGLGLGLTKKEARENLNKDLERYCLKLLTNGKVKEL